MALSKSQVSQLYVSIFNRASEGAGNTYWQDKGTAAAVADAMLATTDAQTYFGSSLATNQAFVEHIYLNTLGKTYAQDKSGIDFWVKALNDGASRGTVVAELVAAVAQYASSTDATTKAAYDQFTNRVAVSDYMADTVSAAPADYATSTAFKAGGLVVTSDAATVTTAKTSVDAVAAANAPKTYTLTTGVADVVESGGGNDTITGTTLTLQSGDIIIDSSTLDSDTFNLTLTAVNTTTPIVKKIENVNVSLDYFTGTGTDLVMTNYEDSTVTIGSSKLGFNGTAGATNIGANTVKAGTGVTTFTVTGLTTGKVDAGSAKTVNVTGTAAAANTIVVNGDITTGTGLTNTMSTLTTLNVTAAATVLYDTTAATNKTTITGDKDITLKMAFTDIITGTSLVDSTSGVITLKPIGGIFDTTNFAVDKIIVDNTAVLAPTVASGQIIETSADVATSLTVVTTSALDTTVTLNLGHDVTLLDVKDDKLVTTINNTDNNAIGTLTATGEKVIVKGSGNLTAANIDVKTLDLSAATGEMVLSMKTTATTSTISGSTGKNTLTFGHVADVISFTGQAGVDTLDVSALILTGTIAGNLGAGNDIVKMNVLGAGTVALEGGAGTDILKITGGTGDTTAATTWAVSDFEEIQLQKAADSVVDAVAVAMNGSQLSTKAYAFTTQETLDTVALTVTANAATTDLSKLTFNSGDTVAIIGRATADDVIIGTSAKDTITVAANKKTVTGGAGDDKFVFVASDSTEASLIKITDYQAAASASDNDTLDVINTGVTADITVDVSAVGTIFASKQQTVNAVVKDGVLKLSGLAADLALVDTFAEMMDIAEYVAYNSGVDAAENLAFEYTGNTYLLSVTTLDATDLVVQLTGLTGVTAVSTTAAANTILVA